MNKTPEKYWISFLYLVLTAATLAVFWRVHNFEFVNYDDDVYVSKNEHIYFRFYRQQYQMALYKRHRPLAPTDGAYPHAGL